MMTFMTAEQPKLTVIPLSPGYFPVTVTYFEKNGNERISAGMIKDKEPPSPTPFPKELLFHKEKYTEITLTAKAAK